jgi:hypothetical protein
MEVICCQSNGQTMQSIEADAKKQENNLISRVNQLFRKKTHHRFSVKTLFSIYSNYKQTFSRNYS